MSNIISINLEGIFTFFHVAHKYYCVVNVFQNGLKLPMNDLKEIFFRVFTSAMSSNDSPQVQLFNKNVWIKSKGAELYSHVTEP